MNNVVRSRGGLVALWASWGLAVSISASSPLVAQGGVGPVPREAEESKGINGEGVLRRVVEESPDSQDSQFDVVVEAHVGGLGIYGLQFKGSGAWGGFIEWRWFVSSGLAFGLRETLTMSVVPYGANDNGPIIGERDCEECYNPSYYRYDLTMFQSLKATSRIDLCSVLAMDMSVGLGFIASYLYIDHIIAALPSPVAGIGFEIPLVKGKQASLILRVSLDYELYLYGRESMGNFFFPQIGLAYVL
jgi:hypothetical protein